jgi:hypothetical protein
MSPTVAQVSIGIGLPNISIGINVPLYPEFEQVPGYPVYYAPHVNSNYFFRDGRVLGVPTSTTRVAPAASNLRYINGLP